MARIRARRNNVNPALAIEAAFRQEVLGHKGIFFGTGVKSSEELRQLAGPPVFPLSPFQLYTQ